MLKHGGGLQKAVRQTGRPVEQWLDLSTGINPNGWPVSAIPASVWSRLPEDDDELVATAQQYYRAPNLLPVAGSQAAIQALPELRQKGLVGVLNPTYAEHAQAWQHAGHEVVFLQTNAIESALTQLNVLVLANPNNPTGDHFSAEQLLSWHQILAKKGGWLLVDEAFIDVAPEQGIAPYSDRPGLIILRSLGKFFGLAGARVGFVCAEPTLLSLLQERLGPWAVNGPSRWVATAALADQCWQDKARSSLLTEGKRLKDTLQHCGLKPTGGTALFQWACIDEALSLHQALIQQGILTRYFSDPTALRFGLPGDEKSWSRLESSLKVVMESQQ